MEMFQNMTPPVLEASPQPGSNEQAIYNEIARFAREALAGDFETARARLRRLIPRLNKLEPKLAVALGSAVDSAGGIRGKIFNQAPVDADSRQNLVYTIYPVTLPIEPSFPDEVRIPLHKVIKEWRANDALLMAGLSPCRSLLFSGPPGVGKSLAAAYLAKSLDLPLLTLDLAAVMSSFLGKTGSNLRLVLDYARSFPCVLFLDEFDTIAKRRSDEADVGELKRLVTVLLQSIDQWPSSSLLIAATNHGDLLDPAVWRRFDVSFEFPLPNISTRENFFKAAGLEENISKQLAQKTHDRNFSELERILTSAKKEAILYGEDYVSVLVSHYGLQQNGRESSLPIKKREKRLSVQERNQEILRLKKTKTSLRQIARTLNISHTTVIRFLKEYNGENLGEAKSINRKR